MKRSLFTCPQTRSEVCRRLLEQCAPRGHSYSSAWKDAALQTAKHVPPQGPECALADGAERLRRFNVSAPLHMLWQLALKGISQTTGRPERHSCVKRLRLFAYQRSTPGGGGGGVGWREGATGLEAFFPLPVFGTSVHISRTFSCNPPYNPNEVQSPQKSGLRAVHTPLQIFHLVQGRSQGQK